MVTTTLFGLLILLAGFPGGVPAAPPRILLEGESLTLEADRVRLALILKRLTEQGVRVRIDPRINPEISASFAGRPVGAALRSILRPYDHALIWDEDTASSGAPRLREIRIFYQGQEERLRPLRNRENLELTRTGDGNLVVRDTLLLRPGPTMTAAGLGSLLARLDATIVDEQAPLGLLRIRLPAGSDVQAVADRMAASPDIGTVEPDYAHSLGSGGPVLEASEAFLPPLPAPFPAAGSATVAVVDSGLQAGYQDSPFVLGVYDAVSPGAAISDDLGHGTQMALIAAGMIDPLGVEPSPEAGPILAIRAIDDNGFTSNYTLLRSIDYAVRQQARVLSLSWGSDISSPVLEAAVRYAAASGLVLVAAAGNAPTGTPVYPAAYDSVIGVGAVTPDGNAWDQSNYGEFVAIQAPGLARLPVGYQGAAGTYAGTSIAAAYTARRVAAILDETPDADFETIVRRLSTPR